MVQFVILQNWGFYYVILNSRLDDFQGKKSWNLLAPSRPLVPNIREGQMRDLSNMRVKTLWKSPKSALLPTQTFTEKSPKELRKGDESTSRYHHGFPGFFLLLKVWGCIKIDHLVIQSDLFGMVKSPFQGVK